MELMLEKLEKDKKSSNRLEMKWCAKVNNENVFRINMITIALDGSEDHLVSKKLMDFAGTEMLEFRKKLLEKNPVSTL